MHTFETKKGHFITHDGILEGGPVILSARTPIAYDADRNDYTFEVDADDLIELVIQRSNKRKLYEAVMARLLDDA